MLYTAVRNCVPLSLFRHATDSSEKYIKFSHRFRIVSTNPPVDTREKLKKPELDGIEESGIPGGGGIPP